MSRFVGFDPNWLHADPITVDQAAALWCGLEPLQVNLDFSISPLEPKLAAVRQILIGAVRSGALAADHTGNPFAAGGSFSRSLVSRHALRTFAESIGQMPHFLFEAVRTAGSTEARASHSGEARARQGRKEGGYQYPADTTIVQQLAAQFMADQSLDDLSGDMICDAAVGLDIPLKTENERNRLIGRIRHRFKKEHPELYERYRRKIA